ncbi:eukaryotic translation initiation factor 4E member 2 [Coprinopsis cinerea okayama7|uniref:Eukaryotic translation initiation factor 4E member 2 n=1 Tax=Coprinopsis cinerea (strain Okayama-7 / 130 / ATCC MYA-4618 / FGSC 9003) TaxID=240176 RepID=A8N9B1_COPC7|nr:eukaryotic translation initiation factor 4E member 2 [Coprinopsis cinerea okayama7\|eukprot:XP_001831439.1 eukaryotic translation initiation factor 4E member 2 [Coprinopsis cinerea okayama7\
MSNNSPNNSAQTTTGAPTTSANNGKNRVSSSKHFSTSVSALNNGERSKSKDSSENNSVSSTPKVHPLRNTWVFWFRQQRAPGNKVIDYEEGIKKIAAFSSVESFWSLWTHLSPPSGLQPTTDYLLFHSNVRRPVWEDPLNLAGGKWIIRLRKGVADRLWEDLVLAVIGDLFDDCRSTTSSPTAAKADGGENSEDENQYPEICGCTISVRQSEDIISLWNRVEANRQVREKIRDTIRRVLNLPPSTIMEYKTNNDSMQDKSSFRNSAIDRATLS